jgi:glycosyltransferase involved in cell wall biosynthesis
MSRIIAHRIYDLYSGGAEVVMLNFIDAYPELHHIVAYSRFYETWLSKRLEGYSNVEFLATSRTEFARQIELFDPNVIVCHYYPPMRAEDIYLLPERLRARVILYHHFGTPVPVINDIRCYCFVSERSKELAGADIPDARSFVVLNPVGNELFSIERVPRSDFIIGRHSRAVWYKFSSDFLLMHESINIPNLTIRVLGCPQDLAEKMSSEQLRHKYDPIAFNGETVRKFLSSLSAYVYCTDASIEESGPMCILEAMASGLPVIAERRGAIPKLIIDGVTGLLFSSSQECKLAVERVFKNSEMSSRMSKNARAWVSKHCSLFAYRNKMDPILWGAGQFELLRGAGD